MDKDIESRSLIHYIRSAYTSRLPHEYGGIAGKGKMMKDIGHLSNIMAGIEEDEPPTDTQRHIAACFTLLILGYAPSEIPFMSPSSQEGINNLNMQEWELLEHQNSDNTTEGEQNG